MLGRSVYKGLICLLLGILVSLPCLVQSDATIDAIKKVLYKTDVTEEETSSLHLPDAYLCDACVALAFSLDVAFEAAVKKKKSGVPFEAILFEIVENLCLNEEHWQSYGLKEIDGKKRFSGPGLKAESTFGFSIEAGIWSHRMIAFCWRVLGERDEAELLEVFKKGELKEFLCYGGELVYCKSKKIADEL